MNVLNIFNNHSKNHHTKLNFRTKVCLIIEQNYLLQMDGMTDRPTLAVEKLRFHINELIGFEKISRILCLSLYFVSAIGNILKTFAMETRADIS